VIIYNSKVKGLQGMHKFPLAASIYSVAFQEKYSSNMYVETKPIASNAYGTI
jgi:hypothetical protein